MSVFDIQKLILFGIAITAIPRAGGSQPVGAPAGPPVGPTQDRFSITRKIAGLELVNTITFVRDGFWTEGIGAIAFVENNGKIKFQVSVGPGDGFEATSAISANDSGPGWLTVFDDKTMPVGSVYEVTRKSGKIHPISLPLGEPVEVTAFGVGQAVVRMTQPNALYVIDGKHYRKLADRHVSSIQALGDGCVLMTSVGDGVTSDTLLRMCTPGKVTKVFDIDRQSTIVTSGREFGILSNGVIRIYRATGTPDTVVRCSRPVERFSFDPKSVFVVEESDSGPPGTVNYLFARRGASGAPTLLPVTDAFGISHWLSVGHGFLWLIATRPTTLYEIGDRLPTQ